MFRLIRYALLAGCVALMLSVWSDSASGQNYRRYSDDHRDYWDNYWSWYDGYYRPYYQRYNYNYPYTYRRGYDYDYRPYYRGYRPGVGVRVGPSGFYYWR